MFAICQYVSTNRELSFAPHSTIRKGERGRVVELASDGCPVVMWHNVHMGLGHWNNATYIPKDDLDALVAISPPTWSARGIALGMAALCVAFWFAPPPAPFFEKAWIARGPRVVERVYQNDDGSFVLLTVEATRRGHPYSRIIAHRRLTAEEAQRQVTLRQ